MWSTFNEMKERRENDFVFLLYNIFFQTLFKVYILCLALVPHNIQVILLIVLFIALLFLSEMGNGDIITGERIITNFDKMITNFHTLVGHNLMIIRHLVYLILQQSSILILIYNLPKSLHNNPSTLLRLHNRIIIQVDVLQSFDSWEIFDLLHILYPIPLEIYTT